MGNNTKQSDKYGRTYHAPISLGISSDDKIMPSGYLSHFEKLPTNQLILTEKLDGQNNCFNQYGLFARTHAQPSNHAWDKPLIERWELIKNDLKDFDIELFGENMFAKHSIGYSNLESYFYLFAVRKNNVWLSWEEVEFYANLFDFPIVPEIQITKPLIDFNINNENNQLENWLHYHLGMSWTDYVQTAGQLGGYEAKEPNISACEGFVIRNGNSFVTNSPNNAFDNVFKLVRPKHIQTDKNWTKNWQKATLKDYSIYSWQNWQFLSNV